MKVIFYPAITIDGFIADETGDSDWVTAADEEMFGKLMESAGAVIVGRTTFDQYRGEIYETDSSKVVSYVCTSRPETDRDKVRFVSGAPPEILQKISDDGFDTVVLSGGGETNGQFAEAGLINEVYVSIYPQTLGKGIKLFGSKTPNLKLKLLSSKDIGEGVVHNHYEVIK